MDKKIKLDEVLIGKKREPRNMEYNWRDIILYALAVGAHREDVAYTYEKYLKAMKPLIAGWEADLADHFFPEYGP